MNIWALSDLHLDFPHNYKSFWAGLEQLHKKYDLPDALVIAGDVCELNARNDNLAYDIFSRFTEQFPRVLYVFGNHESWGSSISENTAKVLGWGFSNLDLIQPGVVVEVKGQRFLGGTMWYPKEDRDSDTVSVYDFIDLTRTRAPKEIYQDHEAFLKLTAPKIQKGDVVVTHHMPSPRAIAPKFANADNHYFMYDVEDIIRSRKPKLWLYGHTHVPMKFTVGETTCYNNAYGYPYEGENKSFWSRVPVVI